MSLRRLARATPTVALALFAFAACGGRSVLSVPDCNADAVAYCKTHGCPLTGPASSTPTALDAWCHASSAFAARVTGYGTCTTPDGQTWATDVKASDASGNTLYLLYDPSSAQLLSVSTLAPGDGGTGEVDYGTCGEGAGLVTCSRVLLACDR